MRRHNPSTDVAINYRHDSRAACPLAVLSRSARGIPHALPTSRVTASRSSTRILTSARGVRQDINELRGEVGTLRERMAQLEGPDGRSDRRPGQGRQLDQAGEGQRGISRPYKKKPALARGL